MNELDSFLMNSDNLKNIAQDILAEAKRIGASDAEVVISANKGFSVSAHDGEPETIEYNKDKSVEIHVYHGKKIGTASLTDIQRSAIHDAVQAASHIAKYTDEDPHAGLADRDEMAFSYPELETAYAWQISVDEAIKLAVECERAAISYDKRIIRAEEVNVATADVIHVLANSHGFVGEFPFTRHEISCVLVAKEVREDKRGKDDGNMERDYYYSISADPHLLESPTTVAKEAAERTIKRLGAKRIATTKAPVLFIAEEARSLMGHFTSAISGRNIYRKSSFLQEQMGKKIFPDFIHIQEFPHLPKALGTSPFDHDAVLTRSNIFVEAGVLKSFALGVYSARKLNMKTTGNAGGVHNLTIPSGKKSYDELIKSMHRGLIVTETMGQGVNILTGDYSRGASGFWVENGEIQHPVHEITVAGNLKNIYRNISEVGTDVDTRGNIRIGSLLINEMMIAGN